MIHLVMFLVSFLYVGLKAWQQLNVTLHKPLWVLPTSYLLAAVEVTLIYKVAAIGPGWIIASVGTGAGVGCLAAMYGHKHLRRVLA